MRQIQLQRLPVVAVIERNPYRVFGPGKQQALADGIFAHRVHGTEVGQAARDQLPTLAAIVRAIDIWMRIVDAETTDRCVRSLFIKVRGRDLCNLAPRRELFGRDVGPIPSSIASRPDLAVVGAGPKRADAFERWSKCIDHAALFVGTLGNECADARWHAGVRPRQVRADRLPRISTIRGLEKHIARKI